MSDFPVEELAFCSKVFSDARAMELRRQLHDEITLRKQLYETWRFEYVDDERYKIYNESCDVYIYWAAIKYITPDQFQQLDQGKDQTEVNVYGPNRNVLVSIYISGDMAEIHSRDRFDFLSYNIKRYNLIEVLKAIQDDIKSRGI